MEFVIDRDFSKFADKVRFSNNSTDLIATVNHDKNFWRSELHRNSIAKSRLKYEILVLAVTEKYLLNP